MPIHERNRIQVRDVSAGYGSATVLEGLSCEAHPGELTTIIGPNGCGKSTLLKAMARVLPITSGSVVLDHADVHKSPTRDVARKLALLPQGPVAPEGLTVFELVSQGRFPHQSLLRQWSREDAEAVGRALEMTFLNGFEHRPVSDLSGGQRQRCWIAMVLAQETPALLLDEPTTFLDLKVQVEVMTLLRRIAHDKNRTIVVVMHDLNVAAAVADHMILMREGKIWSAGSVCDVFNAGNLKDVFDLDAAIMTDPGSGRPICVPKMN